MQLEIARGGWAWTKAAVPYGLCDCCVLGDSKSEDLQKFGTEYRIHLRIMRPTRRRLSTDSRNCLQLKPLYVVHGFSGSSCACVKLTAVFLGGGAVKCGTLEIAWCCHILCGPRLCPLAVGWDFDSNTGGCSEESWREGECMTRPRGEIDIRNETWQSYLGRGQDRTLQSSLAYIVCLRHYGDGMGRGGRSAICKLGVHWKASFIIAV